MLNSGQKNKCSNPPLQVKWSVPKGYSKSTP